MKDTYEILNGPRLQVILCGGAALIALKLIKRATQDVDVLGPPKLPPEFWEAAKVVERDAILPGDWINQGPKDLWDSGLPDGFHERTIPLKLDRKRSRLDFLLTSRFDQIHFKLYAAVDQGPGKHLQDLRELKPAIPEIIQATNWCFKQDVSLEFRKLLFDMLNKQGWSDVVHAMD